MKETPSFRAQLGKLPQYFKISKQAINKFDSDGNIKTTTVHVFP